MVFKDYYAMLGLQHTATAGEIKRAYRQLVRKHHPDASHQANAEAKFREIQEAYEVLSDAAKRKRYDGERQTRTAAEEGIDAYQRNQREADKMRQRSGAAAADARAAERRWRILQQYQKSRGPAAKTKKGEAPPSSRQQNLAKALLEKVKRSLRDSVLDRPQTAVRAGLVRQFTISALESLSESSREIAVAEGDSTRMLNVKIPAGVCDDTVLRVNCPATKTSPAHLIEVKIRVEPHPFVERIGDDILLKIPISVSEAMTGAKISVPTLEENSISIAIPTPWTPEARVKVPGRGLASVRGKRGDLYVSTYIVLPEHLTEPAKQAGKLIDELYTGALRRNVPKTLRQKGN